MSSSDEWVAIALLGRARGNKGEVTARALSDKPERFQGLTSVHLFGAGAPYEVERIWTHGDTLIFKFQGVDSIDAAEKLRGCEVRVPFSKRVPLDEGEYFQSDVVGCEVRDQETGRRIGVVTGWEEYGGPPLLDVDDGRLLIPFVKAICTDIRPAERLILVRLPEGLEELAEG